MITRLEIANYKLFSNLVVDQLSRVTLVGGRNNQGKTSLLEAINFLFDRLNPEMIFKQFSNRGVPLIPLTPETMWAPIFNKYNLSLPTSIAVTIDNVPHKMIARFNQSYRDKVIASPNLPKGQPSPNLPQVATMIVGTSIDLEYLVKGQTTEKSHLFLGQGGTGLKIDFSQVTQKKVIFFPARERFNSNIDSERYGQLDVVGEQDSILEVIREIEPRIKSISVVRQGDMSLIHADVGLGRKIPINYMGDGISRVLSLALAVGTNKNGIVLFDEIENGIHFSVLPKVWKSIERATEKFNCQIIATTHSLECLTAAVDAFKVSKSDAFRYVRISQKDGASSAKVYDLDSASFAVSSEMEIR